MTLLDAVLFLPLIGFLLLLLIPGKQSQLSRMAALVISLVIFVISLGLIGGITPRRFTSSRLRMDQLAAHPLSRRLRWTEPVARDPHNAATPISVLAS